MPLDFGLTGVSSNQRAAEIILTSINIIMGEVPRRLRWLGMTTF